jgi:hypothetical protein
VQARPLATQIFLRWNRLAEWLMEAERFSTAAQGPNPIFSAK